MPINKLLWLLFIAYTAQLVEVVSKLVIKKTKEVFV